MKIVAMMRVKNETRWLPEVIASIKPLTEEIVLFDDHSTDYTPVLAETLGCTVLPSPFDGTLDESRDKNYLLHAVRERNPDYVLSIDGDEVLEAGSADRILRKLSTQHVLYQLPFKYIWNDRLHYRADGVYARYHQWRIFSLINQKGKIHFPTSRFGGNFHCGNTPLGLTGAGAMIPADILHLGYMDAAARIEKYRWYNMIDPNNSAEDCYRHVAQGDLPELPADAKYLHGGPLKIFSLPASKWPGVV